MKDTNSLVLVKYDDRSGKGRIATVMFNNPEKRNFLGLAGKQRFIDVIAELKHDETLRAIILTGAGDKSFVGGSNLAEMAHYDPAQGEKILDIDPLRL